MMPKSRNLSIEGLAVVTLSKEGYFGRCITRKLNFSVCTVQNIPKKSDIGTVINRTRSGRPRATTQCEDRSLICLALSDCQASSETLKHKLQDGTGCTSDANFKMGQGRVHK